MKRWMLRIVVFLLLGAIVNVAVAWGTLVQEFRYVHSQLAMRVSRPPQIDQPFSGDLDGFVEVMMMKIGTRDGFPMNSLQRRIPFLGDSDTIWRNGFLVSEPRFLIGPDPVRLPIRPIWPGFAINTIFYAAILWVLFAAPFALRRRRRIKGGLCPACAYPVGSSDKCTECGALLPQGREFPTSA